MFGTFIAIILLILFFVCIAAFFLWFSKAPISKAPRGILQTLIFSREKYPFRRKDYLLTPTEKNFYMVLYEIAEKNNLLIFAKVRLEDLLWLPRYTPNMLRWRGYVRSRHIDFVLCDRENIKPLLAIELDDSSHWRVERIERDKRINNILHDAGLSILHVRVQALYDLNNLENQIRAFHVIR